MTPQRKLSLNQAAKHGKVAKTTLLNALKKGDISGTKSDNGQWQIEPSELGRWLDSRSQKPVKNGNENISIPRSQKPEKPPETSDLGIEVTMLREQIERMDAQSDRERLQLLDQIEDLKDRLTASQEHAMSLAKLISPPEGQGGESTSRKGFWSRVTGR